MTELGAPCTNRCGEVGRAEGAISVWKWRLPKHSAIVERPLRSRPVPLSSLTMASPAKLNLALSVGAAQSDGMHPIASWMVTLSLADELILERKDHFQHSLFGRVWHPDARSRLDLDWPLSQDLVSRAHHALEQAVGRPLPVKATLRKRIPIGGGLGGGSSNAASVLVGLNALFELGLSLDELERIAVPLGSDVPFLVRGGSVLVEGVGERLTAIAPVPSLHLVLSFPEVMCPTKSVYAMFDRYGPVGLGCAESRTDANRIRSLADTVTRTGAIPTDRLWNDLAFAAGEVSPKLRALQEDIADLAETPVHVSGSGSTLFCICAESITAEALANTITNRLEIQSIPAIFECGPRVLDSTANR